MTIKKDQAVTVGIAVALGLTLCFSALAFSYLRNPPAEDPWTYRDLPDRGPEVALSDIAVELLGTRSQFVKTVAPEQASGSHEIHFTRDRKSTRLNSSHLGISYAGFCLKKKM